MPRTTVIRVFPATGVETVYTPLVWKITLNTKPWISESSCFFRLYSAGLIIRNSYFGWDSKPYFDENHEQLCISLLYRNQFEARIWASSLEPVFCPLTRVSLKILLGDLLSSGPCCTTVWMIVDSRFLVLLRTRWAPNPDSLMKLGFTRDLVNTDKVGARCTRILIEQLCRHRTIAVLRGYHEYECLGAVVFNRTKYLIERSVHN